MYQTIYVAKGNPIASIFFKSRALASSTLGGWLAMDTEPTIPQPPTSVLQEDSLALDINARYSIQKAYGFQPCDIDGILQ